MVEYHRLATRSHESRRGGEDARLDGIKIRHE